jgi:uncharacterized protein
MKNRKILTYFLISCGFLSVGAGIIGIIVPMLPTTPFLLLAAICFAKSSRKFYLWITTNRWFGSYIRSYRRGDGLSIRLKAIIIILLWMSISLSAFLSTDNWWIRGILYAIAIGVTIHILWIKTKR